MAVPLRSCCACGARKSKIELQRFVWKNNMVEIDSGQCLPGRGAYCCSNEHCLRLFLKKKKKWKRLFRL